MVITYYGAQYFKVQFGDLTLAFNPISKDSKLKTSRFGADIALITQNHPDYNGVDQVTFGDKKPFTIMGPGEYEVKEVFIKGLYDGKSKEERFNTIYTVSLEGMNLCFLGALKSKELDKDTYEALPDIDVLFAPIGGGEVLGPSDAYKLAISLEAKLIIPMHYSDDASGKAALKTFLKEGGAEKAEAVDKLTLKKKDLEGKEGEIMVLASSAS